MSKNIDQVYTANPITSNAGTDLMYFGQSPYGAGDDAGMLYSDFVKPIQKSAFNTGTDTGIADAYVVACTPAITSYSPGLIVYFNAANTNLTATPSLDAGAGSVQIVLPNGQLLLPSDIIATGDYYCIYLDNNWALLNPSISYMYPSLLTSNGMIAANDSGTLNTYVASNTTYPGSNIAGTFAIMNNALNTNTGSSMFSNGGGNANIVLPDNSSLVGGEIVATNSYFFLYSSSGSWILLNSSVSSAGVTGQQVQQSAFNVGTDTGIADAYVVALTPAVTSYTPGMLISFIALNQNATTSPTIDAGAGAISVQLVNHSSINVNDISNSFINYCQYSNGVWVLLNPQVSFTESTVVQINGFNYGYYDSGTADNYQLNLSPTPQMIAGTSVIFFPNNNSLTTSPTINLNSTGALFVVGPDGNSLSIGDFNTSLQAVCYFDGARFLLLNPATGYPSPTQVQFNEFNFGIDSGTTDTYQVTLSPAVTAYVDGSFPLEVTFTPNSTNTSTAPTLEVNGQGAKTIFIQRGTGALVPGDMGALSGGFYSYSATCIYNPSLNAFSGGWVLRNPLIS